MNKLILLLTAALAVLAMLLLSIGPAQSDDPSASETLRIAAARTKIAQQGERIRIHNTQIVTALVLEAQKTLTGYAKNRERSIRQATQAATSLGNLGEGVDAASTSLALEAAGRYNDDFRSGCGDHFFDEAHEALCDAYIAAYLARHGESCVSQTCWEFAGRYRREYYSDGIPPTDPADPDAAWQRLVLGPVPPTDPADPDGAWRRLVLGGPSGPGGPSETGGPTGPGGPSEPGGPSGPGGPIGPVYTVGEGLFDIDAGATALHQMVDSPAAAPAFRSICDLPPPRSPAEVVACDLYKAAYRLRHGNPCRHNDEGEAVCLH